MNSELVWWGYIAKASDEEIAARFERRFGYQPQRIVQSGAIKLAGPVRGTFVPDVGERVVVGEIKCAS